MTIMPKILPQVKGSTTLLPAKSDQSILTAAKGGGIMFTGMLLQYGLRFAASFLLARLLGAEQIGLCNLALTAASIATGLSLLGLHSAVVYFISLYASRRDEAGLWGTLQVGLGLPVIVGTLTGVGLFVLADPIAERFFHEPALTPLLRVISLVIPFSTLGGVIAAVARGFKKMQYSAVGRDISQPAIRLILVLVLAITIGLNATGALVTYTASMVVSAAILLYLLNKTFPLNRPWRTARRDPRSMLHFALPVYLSSLVRTFRGSIQTVLLGTLNTITSVGVFTAASQINTLSAMLNNSIATASAPIISELHDRGEREQMGRLYQTVTKWMFTINLPLFLINLLFAVPILSVLGQSFVGGATALVVLAGANLVTAGTGISGTVLDMTGNTSLRMANSIITSVSIVGLNALLIPRWGLMGAAVAALAGATIINLFGLLEVFILLKLLPYNSSFVKPVVAGLVTLAVAWGVRWLSPSGGNLVYTAVNVIVLLVVYVGMILLLRLSEEDRMLLARASQRMSAMLTK